MSVRLPSHKLEIPGTKRAKFKMAGARMGTFNPIIQWKSASLSASDYNLELNNPVGDGNILIAFCLYGLNNVAVPTDSKINTWTQAPQGSVSYSSPAWYALGVNPGTTTVSFSDVADVDPQWFIIIEVGAWTEYDTFAITVNDPPVEEEVSVTTTGDGDLIISVFAGHNLAGEPPSGWTAGDESTELDNEVVPYTTDNEWGVIIQYQQGGAAGPYTSTATYDDSLSEFSFGMAIAFKGYSPPIGGFRPGPLSMSNFVPFSI